MDFPAVLFKVHVLKDADGKLKGQFQGEWDPEGLLLREGKRTRLDVPVGSQASSLDGGRFSVKLGERRIEMAVVGMALYQQRLARDVVAYLNGKRRRPDPAARS